MTRHRFIFALLFALASCGDQDPGGPAARARVAIQGGNKTITIPTPSFDDVHFQFLDQNGQPLRDQRFRLELSQPEQLEVVYNMDGTYRASTTLYADSIGSGFFRVWFFNVPGRAVMRLRVDDLGIQDSVVYTLVRSQ